MFTKCKKDTPPIIEKPEITPSKTGVYITNEGNFQYANAQISYYDAEQNAVINTLFEDANDRPLGDICQSMYHFNGKFYVVVNNSSRIEIVDAQTFKSIGQINGLTAPRYFLPVSNNRAYVSDLYADKISIVDLNNMQVTGYIPCKGWTEEMLLMYGNVYITNQESEYVYIINSSLDNITDSIKISYGANSIVQDKNAHIWVLCGLLNSSQSQAKLYCIDPITQEVVKNLSFSNPTANPWRLNINKTLDTLYFLNNDVFRLGIESYQLPDQAFINANGNNFYGLGICPNTNIIYVSDAIDYVQRSLIFRYNTNGILINSFHAGINAGHFYFLN